LIINILYQKKAKILRGYPIFSQTQIPFIQLKNSIHSD
jgi:hypothetical protein